ncbi:MAG: LiaF domain-containing protein [Nitrolancea sp.]
MSTQQLETRQPFVKPRLPQSLGTIALGAILVLAGLAWILDVLDVVNLTVGLVLASALIAVGILLVAGSVNGWNGGLTFLGVMLALILTTASAVDVPLNSGIGDHRYATNQLSEVQNRYQIAIGNLEVDLSDVNFANGVTTVETRVGIGELVVYVPRDVAVQIHWKVAGGNVDILGINQNGTSLDDRTETHDFNHAARQLVIEASMGFGDIKVRQR